MGRMGNVNISGLKKLQKKLEKAEQEINQMFIDTAKEMAQEFLNDVVKRTPSSNTNELKNDWKCDFNVVQTGNIYTITVENENEIASYIEYGHKTKENGFKNGHFMMTITAQEIEKKFNSKNKEKFEKYLKGVFS